MLQAALTLTLVASSVTMGRTFLKLLDADLGFRSSRVVTLNVSLQGTKHRKSSDVWHYYSEALDRLRSVDGVEAAGSVSYLPLANNVYMASAFKLDSGRTVTQTVINAATPGYFRAMSTPILAGRDFGPAEKNQSESAVIVNEAFARSAGMGTEILGRRITTSWRSTPYLVVGVVGTNSFAGPGFPGGPQIYWPIEEEPPPTITFVAKVHGQAGEYLARCRDAIRSVDRQVPVYEVTTLDARLAEVLGRPKFFTTATLFFAVLALLLAAVGIYGTATYSVAQRMHEMGIRLALGASYERIRTMMLRENLVPVTFGILAGIAGAVASGRYLQHLIVNAESLELRTCAFAAGLLIFTGITASWGATARVLAIDPVDAVRSE
jgi:putative ABC transport system permease protein